MVIHIGKDKLRIFRKHVVFFVICQEKKIRKSTSKILDFNKILILAVIMVLFFNRVR